MKTVKKFYLKKNIYRISQPSLTENPALPRWQSPCPFHWNANVTWSEIAMAKVFVFVCWTSYIVDFFNT